MDVLSSSAEWICNGVLPTSLSFRKSFGTLCAGEDRPRDICETKTYESALGCAVAPTCVGHQSFLGPRQAVALTAMVLFCERRRMYKPPKQ